MRILPALYFAILRALPAFLDDMDGNGVENESTMATPLGALDPAHVVGVRSGTQLAPVDAAQVVGDDVVVTHAAAFAVNAVEELNQLEGLDVEAGFLADFAGSPGGKRFSDFEHTAREGPLALERLTAAPDKKNAAVLNDNGAYADKRCWREFALDGVFHATNHSVTARRDG